MFTAQRIAMMRPMEKTRYPPYQKNPASRPPARDMAMPPPLMQEVWYPAIFCRSSGSKRSNMMPKALVTKRPVLQPMSTERHQTHQNSLWKSRTKTTVATKKDWPRKAG